MAHDTSLSQAIHSTVARDYDAACKRLLSERQILSRILHEWVREFAEVSPQQIERECFEGEPRIGKDPVDRDYADGAVRELAQEDATVAEGMAIFDIRFDARVPSNGHGNGGEMVGNGDALDESDLVRVEIDIEAQNDFNPGYPLLKRGVFYIGRLLSMQGGGIVANSHYEQLRKVVSVWVCAHPHKQYRGTVTSFCLRPQQLTGAACFDEGDYDMVQLVMACLNDKEPGTSPGALGMLETLLSRQLGARQKLERLHSGYGIIVTKSVDEGVVDVCNLSKGAIEEGFNDGYARGRDEEHERKRSEVASLVRDGLVALEEAARRFGFSEQELRAAL